MALKADFTEYKMASRMAWRTSSGFLLLAGFLLFIQAEEDNFSILLIINQASSRALLNPCGLYDNVIRYKSNMAANQIFNTIHIQGRLNIARNTADYPFNVVSTAPDLICRTVPTDLFGVYQNHPRIHHVDWHIRASLHSFRLYIAARKYNYRAPRKRQEGFN